MGAAHEFVLYVKGNVTARDSLRDAILAPIPDDYLDQHFTAVTNPSDDLDGSGQAGAPCVFAMSYRKGSTSDVVDHLTRVFTEHHGPEAVLIVTGDYIDGPAEVYRLGYQPHPDPYGVGR